MRQVSHAILQCTPNHQVEVWLYSAVENLE